MRIYLDKSSEDILEEITSALGHNCDTVTWPDGRVVDFESAYRELYNDFMNNSYYSGGYSQMEILLKATLLYEAMNSNNKKNDVIDAFKILMQNMKPESELDEILLGGKD